tara:strand:- start:494 stop:694 length:201 start_codon:yes stop_codon:yes gene_type:complete
MNPKEQAEVIYSRGPEEALEIMRQILKMFIQDENLPFNRDGFQGCAHALASAQELIKYGQRKPRML